MPAVAAQMETRMAASPGGNDENSGGGGGGNRGVGGVGGNSWTSNLVIGGNGGAIFAQASVSRMVMGGGGGGGSRNNDDNNANIVAPSCGAAGGGIVMIRARKIGGTGTITANGASAFNDTLNDGGGGGGAGGSIIFSVLTGPLTGLTLNANGGRGGDAWRIQAPSGTPGERHGPGGGGGGGFIQTTSAPTSATVTGGANGITTNVLDAYGATPGGNGTTATILPTQIPGTQSGAQCTPTSISLKSFEAIGYDDIVALKWQTGYEIDNLGYNVYRDQNGQRVRITPSVIAGSALVARAGTELTAGYSYAWSDRLSKNDEASDVQYWLEDVDIDGTSTWHGPITPNRVTGLSRGAKTVYAT